MNRVENASSTAREPRTAEASAVSETKRTPADELPTSAGSFFSLRWSYLLPRMLLLGLAWIGLNFGLDPFLRWSLTVTGETLHGAQVDIRSVQTDLGQSRLILSDVAVADLHRPGKNLFAFDSTKFDLETRPLLRRRFVVEQMQIEGLQFGTPRDDDGRLPDRSEQGNRRDFDLAPVTEQLTAGVSRFFNHLVEQTRLEFDPNQLETVRVSEELHSLWSSELAEYERRIHDLKLRIKLLEDDAKRDTPRQNRLPNLARTTLEMKKLVAEAAQLRRDLAELARRAPQDFDRLQMAKDHDERMIRARLEKLQFDADTISRALLGQQAAQQLAVVVEWTRQLQTMFNRQTSEPIAAPRGVTFDFSRPNEGPLVHVKSIRISGRFSIAGQPVPFSGEIRDLSSNPVRLGRPIRFEILADAPNVLHILGELDGSSQQNLTMAAQFEMQLPHVLTAEVGTEQLALILQSEQVHLTGWCRWKGGTLEGRIDGRHPRLQIVTRLPKTGEQRTGSQILRRAFREAASQVQQAQTSVVFQGDLGKPRLWFKSDLGDTLSPALQAELRKLLQPELHHGVEQLDLLAQERSERLSDDINQRLGEFLAVLNLQEHKAGLLLDRIAGRGRFSFDRVLR